MKSCSRTSRTSADDRSVKIESLEAAKIYENYEVNGSFSAVSKPIFASKYSLESSRRDLHNALLCTALESNPKKNWLKFGQNSAKFWELLQNFVKISKIFSDF